MRNGQVLTTRYGYTRPEHLVPVGVQIVITLTWGIRCFKGGAASPTAEAARSVYRYGAVA